MDSEAYLWTTNLGDLDQAVAELIKAEGRRQADKIILIPSESLTPQAVREALGSVFTSIYAEGYPREETMRLPEQRLMDLDERMAYFRRYADRRFYRGAEYADVLEALAAYRAAECFATEELPAGDIHAAVQPLSGAAANMAIYDALLAPGDTVMALDLAQGGHLSHGSPFHQSGRQFHMVRYGVHSKTELLDYDRIEELAKRHKPKLIIAGYTSYPWAPDWEAFRRVADSCGALLLADIAHTAGMAVAGAYPNPFPYADVVMFTTHKTLCGPRGAVVLSRDADVAQSIEAAVFPGAQGGPHVNKFAAIACAFNIARTDAFRQLQHRVVDNAKALASALTEEGLKLAYGGTDTHLLVLDLREMKTPNGEQLMGDTAARLLDLGGIVANKNTIPGDTSAADARGVRYGTPWVTQREMGKEEMKEIASITAQVLSEVRPFAYLGVTGPLFRGKVPSGTLSEARSRVARLLKRQTDDSCSQKSCLSPFLVRGGRAAHLLHEACAGRVLQLDPGHGTRTAFFDGEGELLSEAVVGRLADGEFGEGRFLVLAPAESEERLRRWLEELSDGYVLFDPHDVYRKVQGPAVVEPLSGDAESEELELEDGSSLRWFTETQEGGTGEGRQLFLGLTGGLREIDNVPPETVEPAKPYFVGQHVLSGLPERKVYRPQVEERPVRKTPLTDIHRTAGARMQAFAGYEMPLWYSSAKAEHQAVRTAAGLFDLGHMGVVEVSGRYAESFLNLVTSNYAGWLHPGQSQYAFLLTPEAAVIDDVMVYRRGCDRFLVVVNAANEAVDWDWLTTVNEDKPLLDPDRPWVAPDGPVKLRDLKGLGGEDGRVNLALQGPSSRDILSRLLGRQGQTRLRALRRTEFLELELCGVGVICSRTGYTGEDLGYELYVPLASVKQIWQTILDAGSDLGVLPCGLAARDSLRTEAGLPLHGHELAGENGLLPHEAGFAPYVKLHKPFFVGREAYLQALQAWEREVVRFELPAGGRPARAGAAVVERSGKLVGRVTSCAVVPEGQAGMALLWKRGVEPETPLGVVMGDKLPDALEPGARLPLVQWGKVLPRFPSRETLPQAGPD
ncbi:MAG: serine hydroxymethyltransferase [Candidatus Bipolaricaulota bacterium]